MFIAFLSFLLPVVSHALRKSWIATEKKDKQGTLFREMGSGVLKHSMFEEVKPRLVISPGGIPPGRMS